MDENQLKRKIRGMKRKLSAFYSYVGTLPLGLIQESFNKSRYTREVA